MVNGMTKLLEDPSFKNAIKELGTWLHNTFESFKSAFDKDGMQGVKTQLIATFKAIWTEIKPVVIDAFKELFTLMWEALTDLITPEFLKNKTTKATQTNIETLQKDPAKWNRVYDQLREEGKFKDETGRQLDPKKIDELVADGIKKSDALSRQYEEQDIENGKSQQPAQEVKRHSGTLGMTGNWFEPKGATVEIQKGETVATPGQIQQIIDASMKIGASGGNNSSAELQQLNSLVTQLLTVMKENADYTRRVHDATRALNGNLYMA
jgi:hypothetical protein